MRGQDDNIIWQKAKEEERVLITRDFDFGDDRSFPLQISPGVFILSAADDVVMLNAFRFSHWRWSWQGTKLFVHPEIVMLKYIEGGKICEKRYQCRREKKRISLIDLG